MSNDPGQGFSAPQNPGAPQQPQHAPPVAPPAPSYAGQPAPGVQPASQKTNLMAILSLIFAFVFPLAGIILGHLGLSQIKKTGEGGRGLALTGTILSYVFTFIGLIFFIFYFIVLGVALSDPSMIEMLSL